MILNLIKVIIFAGVVFCNSSYANNFNIEYKVSTAGIKIGKFSWLLEVENDNYYTEINLKNSGLFSPLYKFEGKYSSNGVLKNDEFHAREYKQFWKTKKKIKIIEISFGEFVTKVLQNPEEKEYSRIKLESLFKYFDPITSFINILNGSDEAKTIDGRRVYMMERKILNNSKKIDIKIRDYKNIWADHQRNDLQKIEFYMQGEFFLPEKINVFFKDRVFKLEKI